MSTRATLAELTTRYRGNSRARRMLGHYRQVLDALDKAARIMREERQELWAQKLDDVSRGLLQQAWQHCEAASMPITGEVVARSQDGDRS